MQGVMKLVVAALAVGSVAIAGLLAATDDRVTPSARASDAAHGVASRSVPQCQSPVPFGRCIRESTLGPGAWSWFADERAVHLHRDGFDAVVAGWVDPGGRIVVAEITPVGVLSEHVLARIYEDDHVTPAISVEPDDRITAYWSGHNGQRMFYATTRRPAEITSWDPVHWLTSNSPGRFGYTYPNPVILSAEGQRHYLFWRGGNWEPTVSTRIGSAGWGRAHVVIDVLGQRPYVKVANNGRDRIGLAFTNGHPDNTLTSLYFVEIRGGGLVTAGGARLGRLGHAALRPSPAELVYNARATHAPSWVQDAAFDAGGHPAIVYSTYPPGAAAEYWYARWNGTGWRRHELAFAGAPIEVDEPHYLGGMVLDHNRPDIVFLSREVGRHYVIERWQTGDGGSHWNHRRITTGVIDRVRPALAQELPGSGRRAVTLFALKGFYDRYYGFHTTVAMLSDALAVLR